MSLNLLVVYGSVRIDRKGFGLARFLASTIRDRGHEATLIDPMEISLPLLDRMYKEHPKGEAPEVLERLAGQFRSADGVVIVSAEYNHSIPPALSNLLDHFLEEYFWKPSAIACYSAGPFGGVRAAMQLRAMLGELGMPSIPSLLPVPKIQDAFYENGLPKDEAYRKRADRFLGELEWYAEALRSARASGVPY
ncbi:NADPH-dependent FMN reductase [Tundrisphaera lichenicola]|uniref:NADPH-dependent FMN reductase n=1 Tax=Tundrisphaera lichenicola TaxID=2029860 RepID=UPI003EB6C98A